jgi:hypothetical protein
MNTALATISTLPSNKAELAKFSRMLKDEILASNRDPLPILVQLKVIEKVVDDVLKDEGIKFHFLKEFLLYEKEKIIEVNGAKLEQRETGVKYDYNASGDIVWMDLDKAIKELAEKKKEREKFLQAIPYDAGIVEPISGVFLTKPPKISHTKVKVTL